jgi:hypothetical protein
MILLEDRAVKMCGAAQDSIPDWILDFVADY